MDKSVQHISIQRFVKGQATAMDDTIIVEEPLQILVRHGRKGTRSTFHLAITMRTPGGDVELAYGYLFSEHIIRRAKDVVQYRKVSQNQILFELSPQIRLDTEKHQRHVTTTSSCGACGKVNMEQVLIDIPWVLPKDEPVISISRLTGWISELRDTQSLFNKTGGNHAVALFQRERSMMVKEDVGRHNAMDKVIGDALLCDSIPLKNSIVLVSGRASYELVQKALSAGIPVMAAVGAPSSLAVEMARDHNMTLLGFVAADRCNIYSGHQRISA